jgi:hypothetical protein
VAGTPVPTLPPELLAKVIEAGKRLEAGGGNAATSGAAVLRQAREFFALEVAKSRCELAAHVAAGHIPDHFKAIVSDLADTADKVDALFRSRGIITEPKPPA